MERKTTEKEIRMTDKQETALEKVMPGLQKDLGITDEMANKTMEDVALKRKKKELRNVKIKKILDLVGFMILIGIATYIVVSGFEEGIQFWVMWLILGVMVAGIGAGAYMIFYKKNETPMYERYIAQITNGKMTMYPDIHKQKGFKKIDDAAEWADGEKSESESWRIMDILDGKIVKTLQQDTKK